MVDIDGGLNASPFMVPQRTRRAVDRQPPSHRPFEVLAGDHARHTPELEGECVVLCRFRRLRAGPLYTATMVAYESHIELELHHHYRLRRRLKFGRPAGACVYVQRLAARLQRRGFREELGCLKSSVFRLP